MAVRSIIYEGSLDYYDDLKKRFEKFLTEVALNNQVCETIFWVEFPTPMYLIEQATRINQLN